MAQNKTKPTLEIRNIHWTWAKCQRHEPGNLIRPQECSRNAGFSGLSGLDQLIQRRIKRLFIPFLPWNRLTSPPPAGAPHRDPTQARPLTAGARTGARALTLVPEEKTRPKSQLQPERSLWENGTSSSSSPSTRHPGGCVKVSVFSRTSSVHVPPPHQDPHQSTQDKARFPPPTSQLSHVLTSPAQFQLHPLLVRMRHKKKRFHVAQL